MVISVTPSLQSSWWTYSSLRSFLMFFYNHAKYFFSSLTQNLIGCILIFIHLKMLSNFTFETKSCPVYFPFLRHHCILLPDSSVQKIVISYSISNFSEERVNLVPAILSWVESYVIKFNSFFPCGIWYLCST